MAESKFLKSVTMDSPQYSINWTATNSILDIICQCLRVGIAAGTELDFRKYLSILRNQERNS